MGGAGGSTWVQSFPLIATGPNSDEYLNSAYMEAGLDFNILGVDWREMEGPAKTQVSCSRYRVLKLPFWICELIIPVQVDEVGIYTAHFLEALQVNYFLV